MNGLFSLKSIISENSNFDILTKKSITETYLDLGLSAQKEFNKGVLLSKKGMYMNIAEATSRSLENNNFADFFKDYKNIVSTYSREISELIAKAKINIDTYVDANHDLIDIADNISIKGSPTIKVYDFQNLDNDSIPNVEIEKIFKKEFSIIGKLMQDLGNTIVDDQAKTAVLTTVCNNLQSELQNNWAEKCMCKIANNDCDDICNYSNFATMMYKKFIPDGLRDMDITDSDVQQAKLSLLNISALLSGLEKINNEFVCELNRVADEIGSIFFRNKDMNMPIKTNTEGIANRNYKLSSSAFNQFNIFMTNKCDQITELCNLYTVAISIKADMIFKYVKQCVAIIERAKNGVDNTPSDYDPELDNASDMDDMGHIDFDEDFSDDKDTTGESEFDEAAYLFEADLFELDRLYEQHELSVSASNYLTEANINGDGILQKIKGMIEKILANLNKFFDFKTKAIDKYIEQLKGSDYQKKLKAAPIPNGMTIDWIDVEKLQSIAVSNKNFGDSNLDDINKYIKASWPNILKTDATLKSITDDILSMITDTGRAYTDKEREDSINFLTNKFNTACNDTKNSIDKLKNSLDSDIKAAKNGQINIGESAITMLEQMMVTYFSEADGNNQSPQQNTSNSTNNTQQQSSANTTNNQASSTQNNNTNSQNNSSNSGNNKTESYGDAASNEKLKKSQTRVNNYYTANIRVISAKLNLLKKTAMKQIDFLKHIPIEGEQTDNNNNTDNKKEGGK